MEICCKINKIFYQNETFASLLVEDVPKEILAKEGKSSTVCKAAGRVFNPYEGATIVMTGDFIVDPNYGLQFKIESSNVAVGNTCSEILAFLQSGFISGVGPATAQRIYDKFGKDTINVIENNPEKLIEVKGITQKKADKIHESYKSSNAYLELINFFKGEATQNQIETIYSKYGKDSISKLKINPYIVIEDLDGFGFKKADKLASYLKIKKDDHRRIEAAIIYVLKSISNNGHVYCLVDSLEENFKELMKDENIDINLVADAIIRMKAKGSIIIDENRIYWYKLYQAECGCAKIIKSLIKQKPFFIPTSKSLELSFSLIEDKLGFPLENHQKKAVKCALSNCISVITGGPGTGKTTIIQAIIKAYGCSDNVILAAPTGRASRRISESCHLHAQTVHRWLIQWNNKKLDNKLIIVDEASMLDLTLAHKLLNIMGDKCSVVFIGDIDQLPPIGPGNFFRDLVKSIYVPSIELIFSHRNAGYIAINANRINNGQGCNSWLYDDTFKFYNCNKEIARDKIVDEYCRCVIKYGLAETQCIVPQKNRGFTSTKIINELIRNRINPFNPYSNRIEKLDLRVGDRVMNLNNDYIRKVFNGDCGIIIEINIADKIVKVLMDDKRTIEFTVSQARDLTLAFAITIHKSQGSEYRAVIVSNTMENYMMLQRNLLYTAVTRAKSEVIVIGEDKAIHTAVSTLTPIIRNTQLRNRLRD